MSAFDSIMLCPRSTNSILNAGFLSPANRPSAFAMSLSSNASSSSFSLDRSTSTLRKARSHRRIKLPVKLGELEIQAGELPSHVPQNTSGDRFIVNSMPVEHTAENFADNLAMLGQRLYAGYEAWRSAATGSLKFQACFKQLWRSPLDQP
jgi:hypothetical protein